MVNPLIRRVYNWGATQWLLTLTGLDTHVRKLHRRYQEIRAGTTEFKAGDVQVQLSDTTIPDGEIYLEPEKEALDDLVKELQPDDVFWDIGADEGLYTCLSSKVISNKGSVVAFEPTPFRRNRLKRNLDRNGLTAVLRTEALTNVNGEAEFGYGIKSENEDGDFIATLSKGDRLVAEEGVPQPSVVKIDVEGAEYEVIQGMRSTLESSKCRVIHCELHSIEERGFEGSKQEVKQTLEDLGFEISTIATRVGDGWEQPFLKGVKK